MSNNAFRYSKNTAVKKALASLPITIPQTKKLPGRKSDMVKNNAGGVVFTCNRWEYLDRFLILGSDAPSYYATAKKLTADAAKNVIGLINVDGVRVVNRTVEISDSGRAPKNDSAIFVLALCAISSNPTVADAAYAAIPKVCRIGTHLFAFVSVIDELGKWNAKAKRGIATWYNQKAPGRLAYQLLKYQQRNGWSHRDVLRLAHIKPQSIEHAALFRWTVKKDETPIYDHLPKMVEAYDELKADPTEARAVAAITNNKLSWEMLPTELLKSPAVWEALLPEMGITAIIRNLGRMSSINLLKPMSDSGKLVISKLTDAELLQKGRVHPISILAAAKTYAQGRGEKGKLTWSVNHRIVDTLNDSLYASFGQLPKTDKKYLLGLDCSGSMFGAQVNGIPNLVAAEVGAVMALVIAKTAGDYWIGGFDTTISELKISPNMRLDKVLNVMEKFNWAGTDCAQPMLYALKRKMDVDLFCTITDNETWAGAIHPTVALQQYRQEFNKGRLVVAATSVTEFTVADPLDDKSLDIVGFDTSAPELIASFAEGKI